MMLDSMRPLLRAPGDLVVKLARVLRAALSVPVLRNVAVSAIVSALVALGFHPEKARELVELALRILPALPF